MRIALNVFVCLLMSGLLTFGIHMAVTAEHAKNLQGGLGIAIFSGTLLAAVVAWLIQQRRAARRTPSRDVRERVLFKRRRAADVTTTVACVMLGLSFYLLDQADMVSERRAWLLPTGMWLFAGVALLGLFSATKTITLTLSPQGLDCSPFKAGVIAWSDIRGFQIKTIGRAESIVLEISNPEKYKSSHPIKRVFRGLDQKVLGSEFSVMPAIFGEKTELVADEIRRRIDAFGKARAGSDIPPYPLQDTLSEAP